MGGYFEEINFIRFSNENVAYQEVSNGNLDMYLFQIPLQLIESAERNPKLKIYEKEGLSYGLLLNPSVNNQTFNPLSIKDIRYALNFLIDRNFIVNDILKGFGISIVEPYGPTSPEYKNTIDVIEPLQIRYDWNFASNIIKDSMIEAGAELGADGKYVMNGKPVVIKILIRNDDLLRKSFGDLVATEIQRVGFEVVREYGDLTKANSVVYGSNPADLEWNIYTESFISGTFSRYNPNTVGQMYAPWFGNMPGSQNPAFWQYANSSIDETSQKLIFNNYTSKSERNLLLKNTTLMGVQEAVRLFFARSYEPYISSSSIHGLINDLSAGIANKLAILNAHKNSSFDNNTLDIGMKQIFQGAWNNVKGCTDFYCRMMYSLISDNPLLMNPYSGDPEPFRNIWTKIVSNGPADRVKVASDAIVWDPYLQKWVDTAKNNSGALTKITMHPLFSNWHNGEPIDKYDLLYSYYFPYEWAIQSALDDNTYDSEYASLVNPTLSLIKGIKFYDNGTYDSYVDLWHYDKKQIPMYGTLWASEPWEITAATERLVSQGKISYSKTDSNIRLVEQLSLNLPTHSQMIKQELTKMLVEKYIPNPLKGQVSYDYVSKRYNSSIQWIENHHNAVIGNGPYFLNSFNPVGGTVNLKEFDHKSYPYLEGDFSVYETPPVINIEKIDVPKFVKIDEPFEFELILNSVDSNNNLHENFTVNIDYFVMDRNNDIVIEDTTLYSNDFNMKNNNENFELNNLQNITVALNSTQTDKLIPGPAKLKLIITTEDFPKPIIYERILIVRP